MTQKKQKKAPAQQHATGFVVYTNLFFWNPDLSSRKALEREFLSMYLKSRTPLTDAWYSEIALDESV